MILCSLIIVVLDTTKVQIFKQITTEGEKVRFGSELFQIPQRYRFSSKSQHLVVTLCCADCCFRYHKGTDFQANHNNYFMFHSQRHVVLDTTKVQIFKQITTANNLTYKLDKLFQIPQRYRFSSKSQQVSEATSKQNCCFRYHKGTDFQANHNIKRGTTNIFLLFQIPQRYRFSSKSQLGFHLDRFITGCFRYHKGTDFQANHNTLLTLTVFLQLFQIPQRYRFSSKSQQAYKQAVENVVVLDTTKVQIFKQITTVTTYLTNITALFQIPQRYRFSSKSQHQMFHYHYSQCCFRYHKGTDFQANHNSDFVLRGNKYVVLDTTKVQIFKQITTKLLSSILLMKLFQIPQRYRFSSKSQQRFLRLILVQGCFRYHKGTDFQANHNKNSLIGARIQLFQIPQRYRFSSKSQLLLYCHLKLCRCFRYHKGTDFQANHNSLVCLNSSLQLFQIPQRYRFSSKSQLCKVRVLAKRSCFRYHKGTDFQANHNLHLSYKLRILVVLDTTKVQIFKQITTDVYLCLLGFVLFQIPQRYRFSSKSQQSPQHYIRKSCCFRYHKGTDFQANHNLFLLLQQLLLVVLDTTKVQIFKQITTITATLYSKVLLFQIPQRYRFSSKSQQAVSSPAFVCVVLDTTKVQIFKQITTYKKRKYLSNLLFQIPQRYRFSSKSQHKKCTVSIC